MGRLKGLFGVVAMKCAEIDVECEARCCVTGWEMGGFGE